MLRLSPYKAILLAAFGALQIADVITTKRVLANGGWEGNPIGVLAMTHLGAYWPVAKLALMAVCMTYMIRWNPKYVAAFVALMVLVVANNALWAYA
jgi:hypothetical protein